MLFYLGLRGWVNGEGGEEPPQICATDPDFRRRFTQMGADEERKTG